MTQISGGCLCGAIRYSCEAPALMTAMCNCTNCQKQSGSAFSINVGVPKAALSFTAGRPAVYEDRGDSGEAVWRHFCARCGSPLFSDVALLPDLSFVKAGTLDDTSWVKPSADVWCKSAQSWVAHPDGVPKSDENPPMG